MQENLEKMQKFFKYNLEIKNILYNTMPKETDKYNKESIMEYSDKLFKAINDIEYYIDVTLNNFDFSEEDKKYFRHFIKALKSELIKSGYNYDKLKKFYETFFANMSEELVNNVGENCVGYSMYRGINLSKAKSLNEVLHVLHQTIVNNEIYLQAMPKISEKTNSNDYSITLYGNQTELASIVFNSFSTELDCGITDIVSLSDNNIIMMVRDRGHALSIEIEKENDKYYVKYFIPKINNVDMVNELKGVRKVTDKSRFTTGIFETNLENLTANLTDFIGHVPTDLDNPQIRELLESRGIQR